MLRAQREYDNFTLEPTLPQNLVFSGFRKNAQTRSRKEEKELDISNNLDCDGEWNEDEEEGEDKLLILITIRSSLRAAPLMSTSLFH